MSTEHKESHDITSYIVAICALAVSIAYWVFYYSNKLTLSYNDARSHLNISRRVVDSLQPGLAQLGSVWLPLPHVLQLLTIWNDTMYRTGLSGGVISMLSYVGSVVLAYKISRELELTRSAALVGALVVAANQNLLFLQATPMTESLLIVCFMATIYFLVHYARHEKLQYLIGAGIFTFMAILTRYDGWFLYITATAWVYATMYLMGRRTKAESRTIVYSTIGGFGLALWFLWNKVIFGSWLFFLNSEYSAKAQQEILYKAGRLPTKGNIIVASNTYLQSMILNIGGWVLVLGALGILSYLASRRPAYQKLIIIPIISPIIFNTLSLYLGHSTITLPTLPPYNWFNVRYGLMALPMVALGTAALVNKSRIAAILAAIIILTMSATTLMSNSVITVQDGVHGSSGYFLDDIGDWIHTHAGTDGNILVAASSHDALIFVSGLPLKRFITEGIYRYWGPSLRDPRPYAKFVIMSTGDSVWRGLHTNPAFTGSYDLVYHGQFADVYRRRGT